ncbi:MAG: acyltransferase [Bacteroidetes bacterium]|nr:acyltransferase [Bacteroidota bacterium]
MSKYISYFPKIDSLRTIAVTMTLLAHFITDAGWKRIEYMNQGVYLFFTISGFLITSILLKAKDRGNEKGKISVVINFIIRRGLRLFPIYYLFLLALICIKYFTNLWLWNDGFGIYYFTYTSNFLFFSEDIDQSSLVGHIWTLGVEEQFYILWPWLIIFFNKKPLKYLIVFFILCGLVFSLFYIKRFPFSNYHTLGIGAFLAYINTYKVQNVFFQLINKYNPASCFLFILLFFSISQLIDHHLVYSNALFICREIFLMLSTVSLLMIAISDRKYKIISPLLNNKIMQYIGKISYGIYLYHKPIPFFINMLCKKNNWDLPPVVLFIIYIIITIMIAILSYKYIELFFLKLKEKFDK